MFFNDQEDFRKLYEEQKKKYQGIEEFISGGNRGISLQQNLFNSYASTVIPTTKTISEAYSAAVKSLLDFETPLKFTIEESNKIQKAFGLSRERIDDFKVSLANAAPELLRMGVGADEAKDIIVDVGFAFGNTGVIGKEAITELAATTKLTGIETSKLATNFREVGISIYDVGDTMKEVANYAKSVGVSVKAVSDGVVSNLGKMNLFNFDNGVKGLTKMAAQAARLGIDLNTTFTLAEKVFDPEGAIDLAASLQRLGVASNDLLDPLRAMDLAQNDPEELQNQLVDLTKTFTKFNQESGKFEILPGEKRRIREIAKEMGILPEKLAEMSIKAAEFDRKMKSIEFPTANKEEQELIASLSQISGGTAVIEIEGKMKDVSKLTSDDIKSLKDQEAEANKSIEELARDQLNQLEDLNANVSALVSEFGLGLATSKESLRAQKLGNTTISSLFKEIDKEFSVESVRETSSKTLFGPIEEVLVKYATGNAKLEDVIKQFEKFGPDLKEIGPKFEKSVVQILNNYGKDVINKAKEIYTPVINKIEEENKKKNAASGNNSVVTVNHNFKFEGNPEVLNKLSPREITEATITGLKESNASAAELKHILRTPEFG